MTFRTKLWPRSRVERRKTAPMSVEMRRMRHSPVSTLVNVASRMYRAPDPQPRSSGIAIRGVDDLNGIHVRLRGPSQPLEATMDMGHGA